MLITADARTRLDSVLKMLGRQRFDESRDSAHWLLFSQLAIKFNDRHVSLIEIGTFSGFFTLMLSLLYRSSHITTIELPSEDPIYQSTYNRDSDERAKNSERLREHFLSFIDSRHLRFIRSNTLFIDSHLASEEKFDLIWVDGSHNYPEIAWDLQFSLRRIKPGGYILVDDVKKEPKFSTVLAGTAVFETIQYISDRIKTPVEFRQKRAGRPEKHIAIMGPF